MKNKYKNKKNEYDGIVFDSKKELDRYKVLIAMEHEGEIQCLKMQVPFVLLDSVKFHNEIRKKPAVKYIADFVYYTPSGCVVIEDVKSDFTRSLPVYRLKKHMMRAILGLDISEV